MRFFGYFFPPRGWADATAVLAQININLKALNMTVTEGFNKLAADAKQTNKALTEIQTLVSDLKDQIAKLQDQELTDEQTATVDQISETAQKLDDIVPDPVTVPAPDAGAGTGA